jgi:hypothetical protein
MTGSVRLGTAGVLLVEDDSADVLLTTEALAHHHLAVQLNVADDGETAMRFLRRTGTFTGVPRPAAHRALAWSASRLSPSAAPVTP